MEKILIFIKHHFKIIWIAIEKANGIIFSFLYKAKMNSAVNNVFKDINNAEYRYRKIKYSDLEDLEKLINSQKKTDIKYFKPHGFDLNNIKKQYYNPAFLMMGSFHESKLVGYFFLRFFANRKCFVGRLIDTDYRGKGIGLTMNRIMYKISWEMGFRCLSTISKNNHMVIKAHRKNSAMIVLKELPNDYLLVEFLQNADQQMNL